MDVVGQGHRCASCSQNAAIESLTGSNDLAHHLTSDERNDLRASGAKAIWIGILMAAIGAILVPFWSGGRTPLALVGVGILTVIGAIGTMRYARGHGGG